MFHHIPDWPAAVSEIKRDLRPGGYLIWLDLVIPRIVKTIFKPVTKSYGLYTIDDILAAFAKEGFEM